MMSIEMSKMVLRRALMGVLEELNVKLDWYSSRSVLFWAAELGVALAAVVFLGVCTGSGVVNTVLRLLATGVVLSGVSGMSTEADGVYRVLLRCEELIFAGVLLVAAVELAVGLNKVLRLFITGVSMGVICCLSDSS